MDEDFNKDNSNNAIKKFFANLDSYFKSLTRMETIAWTLIGVGLVFVILGIILM